MRKGIEPIVNPESKTSNRVPLIGIAGGIGAGKSSVARILGELGCVVSESDAAARAALHEPHIRDELVRWWGSGIVNPQGAIDRSAVASIVFSNPGERRRLERLTHPWIEARRKELFARAPADAPALVIDAPLLFEAGLDSECDAVIFVDSSRSNRLQRVAADRHWNDAELDIREQSQLALDEKRSRADYIVTNDGDWSELKAQVRGVLQQIVATSRL